LKNVLIIGIGSYIGNSFAEYAKDRLHVTSIGARNNEWRAHSFTKYDSILHCAGIAHVKSTKENENLYYAVNRDMAVEVARKAKQEGVQQFVFLSSFSAIARQDTVYGKSKHQAEQALQKLEDDTFKVCSVRPPMVYGPECRGNFPSLVKLAKLLPLFPDYPNSRSMIYIDNLNEHLCQVIETLGVGVSQPHNAQYVNTTDLVKTIRAVYSKRTYTTRIFNPILRVLTGRVGVFNKLFGDMCYEMQGDEAEYNVVGFEEGVNLSVMGIPCRR
jgi:UDP-glucose 4-epimerase